MGRMYGVPRGRGVTLRASRPSRSLGAYVTVGNRAGGRTRNYMKARKAAGTRTASKLVMYRGKKNNIKKTMVKSSRGGLPSFSVFRLSNRLTPVTRTIKRATEPNFWVNNFGSQIINSEGFQSATTYSYANLDHLNQMAAMVPGAGSAFPQAPKRYLLESVVGEFLMTNSSLATQYVDIYDIVRKRDAGNIAGGVSDSGEPLAAWKRGISDQSPAPPDMTAWQNINSLPTDSKVFCDYFRVVKRSHIGLTAGATHRHQVILKPNRIIDTSLLNELNGDPKGITVYTMVVINGQPASIKSETGALVTTAQTALDIVWSSRFKFTWLADNSRVWKVQDNLVSLTGEQVTQDGLGAFVPNAVY